MKSLTFIMLTLVSVALLPIKSIAQALNQFKFITPVSNLVGVPVNEVRTSQGFRTFQILPQALTPEILRDTIMRRGVDTMSLDQTIKSAFNVTLASGNRNTHLVLHARNVRMVFLGPNALRSPQMMISDQSIIAGVLIAGEMRADLTQDAGSKVNFKKMVTEAGMIFTPIAAAGVTVGTALQLVGGLDSIHMRHNTLSVAHWGGRNLVFAVYTMRVKNTKVTANAMPFKPEKNKHKSVQFPLTLGSETDPIEPNFAGFGMGNFWINTNKGRQYSLAYVRVNDKGEHDPNGKPELVVQVPQTVMNLPDSDGKVKPTYPKILLIVPRTDTGPEGDQWKGTFLIDDEIINNGDGLLLVYVWIDASQANPSDSQTKLSAKAVNINQGANIQDGKKGNWSTCLASSEYYFRGK